MEVLVEPLDDANFQLEKIVRRILQTQKSGRNIWIARSVSPSEDGGEFVHIGLGIVEETGFDAGSLDGSCRDEGLLRSLCGAEPALAAFNRTRCFVQPAGLPARVFLFGGGHVAQPLAMLCQMTGFRTVVVDDRSEFADAERFPQSEIVVPASFEGCFSKLDVGPYDFLVIVTRGHAFDKVVLAQALRTQARYIGMIGSRRKQDAIYKALADEGVVPEKLTRVRSPIGLAIGARTPEEIAVSIAAELIAVRSGLGCGKDGKSK